MKKKITIIALLILMIGIGSINAAVFNNYLPSGKNHLDENNLVISNDTLSTVNEFLVKENTFYTISFPGYDLIPGNIYINIYGNGIYFDGLLANEPNCTVELQWTWCTFETEQSETYLNIEITSSNINHYFDYYGLHGFQLEEGDSRTSYEVYIPPFMDTGVPEFSGAGAYIKSYSSYESINNIINNHIIVFDEIDGDISESIIIVSDTYTTNEQVVGEYLVELSASDSSGNTAYFSLTILVKDEIDPVIIGPTNLNINISDVTNINKIITDYFVVSDEYSTVSINILVDNYTASKDNLGTYMITFEAVDEYSNTVSHVFNVTLVDIDSPTVVSNLHIDSYLSNPLDLTSVLDTLEFTDNYDDMTNTNINVISNQFNGNESIPGTYIIIFEVSDSSGNTMSNNLVVNVIDDVLPVISGPIAYQGSYDEGLTVEDFINMLNVSDNSDNINLNDIYIIEDTYTNRTSLTGNFIISFGVIDSNNNEDIHSITITLFDDVAPVIYIDNYIVTVDSLSTFTTDDALTLLLNSNELSEGTYTVTTLFNEYLGNELNEGTYIYLLEFTNEFGESYQKEFLVKVVDKSKIEINDNLFIRNMILYSISIGFFGFVVIKNKK